MRFRQRASQAAFLTLAASYMDAVWVEGITELAETGTDMGDPGHRLKALRRGGQVSRRCVQKGGAGSDVVGRIHPPVKDAHDFDHLRHIAMGSKIDHVALLGVAVEPLGDVWPGLPECRVVAKPFKAAHQRIDVPIGLPEVPVFGGVDPDLGEIRFGPGRKPIDHFRASCLRPAALIRSASLGSSLAS